MKKILFGLIVCALLVGMTGVVSAAVGDYCKVTGGGTVVDSDGNAMNITVSFTAQGTCGLIPSDEDYDVKGKVTIVDHATKEIRRLDVITIIDCAELSYYSYAWLFLEDGSILDVYDGGEGVSAYYMDGVYYWTYWEEGYLSGNAQVTVTAPA